MTEVSVEENLELNEPAEPAEPTEYELFVARCTEAGVETVPTKAMYTRWGSGNVRAELKGLSLADIENRHIAYWQDQATDSAESEADADEPEFV